MARPEIKNLNDLNDYLLSLEEHIAELENQDKIVNSAINDVNQDLQYCMDMENGISRIKSNVVQFLED
jgi:predicted type IV restriction endonuclease